MIALTKVFGIRSHLTWYNHHLLNGLIVLVAMSVKLVDSYFSDTLKWTIAIGSASGTLYILYMASYLWIIFILLLITLISFSTKYVMEVDIEKKCIIDSFYFLWIRTKSDEIKFDTLNCIRIDKQRHIYNASTRSRDRQTSTSTLPR